MTRATVFTIPLWSTVREKTIGKSVPRDFPGFSKKKKVKKKRKKMLTFTLACDFISKHVYLMNSPVFLKHCPELFLVHRPWNLADEHFNKIRVRLFDMTVCSAVHHSVRFRVHLSVKIKTDGKKKLIRGYFLSYVNSRTREKKGKKRGKKEAWLRRQRVTLQRIHFAIRVDFVPAFSFLLLIFFSYLLIL